MILLLAAARLLVIRWVQSRTGHYGHARGLEGLGDQYRPAVGLNWHGRRDIPVATVAVYGLVRDPHGLRHCRSLHLVQLGLLGNIASVQALPAELPLYAGAVFLGSLVGTTFGIKLASRAILKALGVVLVIAGLKMLGIY